MHAGRSDLVGRVLRLGRRVLPGPVKERLRWLYTGMPRSWQMSSEYRALTALLHESQWWSEERLRDFQLQQLRGLVGHAARNVPGHGRRFAEYGVGPETIRSLEDLRRFPTLGKEDLRGDPRDFLARGIPEERLQLVTSGGTTGLPTGFYHLAQYNEEVTRAFRLAMWGRIGFSFERRILDLTASFGGPFGYVPQRRSLYVSIAYLDRERMDAWLDRARRFRPEYILGLPSTVVLLAQLLRERGAVDEFRFRGLVVGSEVIYPWQRAFVSETFGCRVLSWYGMAETAGFAAGCEHGDEYHFSPEAGCVELLDDQGNPVTREGEEGEIVLTGFHTRATPFIRYRTGDRGVLGAGSCARCGRNYPLVREIAGRRQEFLVAANGRRVPNSALNVHHDLFHEVRSYQFFQDAPGRVELRIVRGPAYLEGTTAEIREQMLRQLGAGFEMEIRFVDEIARTGRGKHRFIVQEIPADELDRQTV